MKKKVIYSVSIAVLLLALVFTGGCAPTGEDGGGFASFLPLIIMLGLMGFIFYFLLIRPMRQRERRHDEMVSDLERGDEVITAGGLYGVVKQIDDNSVVLEVESGALIRVTKGGVIQKPED